MDEKTQPSSKYFVKRNLLLAALFLVFLFLRLFTDTSLILLGSDNLKYLYASETFPLHKMYNDQLYLLHPPMFPYAIHFLNSFIDKDYMAAIAVSLISSIATFFLLYKFFMMITGNFPVTYFVLVFYTLSVAFVSAARAALKESFIVMLIIATLYFYVAGLKYERKRYFLLSALSGAILGFAADHVIFVLPALVVSYLIFNRWGINLRLLKFKAIKYAVFPILVTFISYSGWLLIKFLEYSGAIYFPNGVEGTPVSTESLTLLKVITPTQFEDFNAPFVATGALSLVKRLIFHFGYMFNMEPFSIPRGINLSTANFLFYPYHLIYMVMIYLPLSLVALYGFVKAFASIIKGRKIQNNFNLYITILFFIFLVPLTKPFASPRFIYTSYIFLFYFLSYGLYLLFSRKKSRISPNKVILLTAVILLLIIPYWYYKNPYPVYSIRAHIASEKTGDFINQNLEKDAMIIAQPGYGVKVMYLTKRKTIGLHPDPDKFIEHINFYDADYVVFGKKYTLDFYHYSLDTINYIENNPSKFKLIADISEDYSQFYVEGDPARNDRVYIYKILKS